MSTGLKELCPHVTDAIMLNADLIGRYWFECDVHEQRDNPHEHVPTLIKLQASLVAREYLEDEEVIERFMTKAVKRNYLQRVSNYLETKDARQGDSNSVIRFPG